MTTGISWADETWNPFIGCTRVSPACVNCYAQDMAARIVVMEAARGRLSHYEPTVRPTDKGAVWTGELARAPLGVRFAPFKWGRPRDIFVGSMTDFFHASAPDEWRIEALAVMALNPRHKFLLLTKRAADMRRFMTAPATVHSVWKEAGRLTIERDLCTKKIEAMQPGAWPLPNVALGVTAEDQAHADERIPDLLATPAAKRFVSGEPLLGELNLEPWLPWPDGAEFRGRTWGCPGCDTNDFGGCKDCPEGPAHYRVEEGPKNSNGEPAWVTNERVTLDWLIAGGESGAKARPSHPDWFRLLCDQCAAAGVPFHFKQWGEYGPCELLGPHPAVPYSVVTTAGRHLTGANMLDEPHEKGAEIIRRFGTARAGHLLDGAEHRARINWSV